jgi:hypothetical protein
MAFDFKALTLIFPSQSYSRLYRPPAGQASRLFLRDGWLFCQVFRGRKRGRSPDILYVRQGSLFQWNGAGDGLALSKWNSPEQFRFKRQSAMPISLVPMSKNWLKSHAAEPVKKRPVRAPGLQTMRICQEFAGRVR